MIFLKLNRVDSDGNFLRVDSDGMSGRICHRISSENEAKNHPGLNLNFRILIGMTREFTEFLAWFGVTKIFRHVLMVVKIITPMLGSQNLTFVFEGHETFHTS